MAGRNLFPVHGRWQPIFRVTFSGRALLLRFFPFTLAVA